MNLIPNLLHTIELIPTSHASRDRSELSHATKLVIAVSSSSIRVFSAPTAMNNPGEAF
jgi:hypothetical protein